MICCISIGGFVNYVNLYNGYTSAKIYTDDLEHQINEVDKTKNIDINFDDILYDSRYKYRCETVVDSMRLDLIRQYKDIPTDTKFTFTSEKYNVSNMCYNNVYSPAPIITDSSGNRLVSILGIQCFVDNNNAYTVDYENSSIYIINDSKNTKYVFYTNKTLSSIVDNKETIKKEKKDLEDKLRNKVDEYEYMEKSNKQNLMIQEQLTETTLKNTELLAQLSQKDLEIEGVKEETKV